MTNPTIGDKVWSQIESPGMCHFMFQEGFAPFKLPSVMFLLQRLVQNMTKDTFLGPRNAEIHESFFFPPQRMLHLDLQ